MARAFGEAVMYMMPNVEVMSIVGLESTAYRAVKNYTSLLLHVPTTLFKTWFEFHVKVVKLPFNVVSVIWKFTPWGKTSGTELVIKDVSTVNRSLEPNGSIHVTEPNGSIHVMIPNGSIHVMEPSGSNSEPTMPSVSAENNLEPRSEDIVRNVKRLRNCAAMSIAHFTGEDIFWDVPILSQKVKRFSEAVVEGDPVKIAAARETVEQHPVIAPKPKSKQEYNRLMKEAMEISEHSAVETVPKTVYENLDPIDDETRCESSGDRAIENKCKVSMKSVKKVCFRSDNEQTLNQEQGVEMNSQRSQELFAENAILKNRLSLTCNKLDEVLKSSNSILDEVTRLNEQFGKLTAVSSKITLLQYELEKGKQILEAVEEERNLMRQKLLALEKLIKEEEEYLDEISCESGYEEVENVCDSPDEL